tara:strand:- start:221 stop:547 length:327 start_codon:yes stop_codon:yes gene_type:complete
MPTISFSIGGEEHDISNKSSKEVLDMVKTEYDNGDNQLTDIEVSEEQFNRWLTNCKKNKSHTSWIYLDWPTERRKVYLIEGDVLYCNALDKSLPNAWHSIIKRLNPPL